MDFKLDLLSAKIEKTGSYDFVQGWGTAKLPMVLANSSNEHVRVPGNMKAHSVAIHPSATLNAGAGWRSPVAATVRVEGEIARAHAECGTGVMWSLELRRGNTRQFLAQGEARRATPVSVGPIDNIHVQPGDLISVLVGAREGNQSCNLTAVDLRLTDTGATHQTWSLASDVAGSVLAGNPHADATGHPNVWHFYTEPVAKAATETILPAGSLLARWQSTDSEPKNNNLRNDFSSVTSSAPKAEDRTPDAELYRQLMSLAGPLFANVTLRRSESSLTDVGP